VKTIIGITLVILVKISITKEGETLCLVVATMKRPVDFLR
jgi:hypothetical protein